jgi:hypothetical protein
MNPHYQAVKKHYENTKPIRGRAVDVRPADKRRRDWEKVTNPAPDTYAFRLYNTDCVIHEPNRMTFACGDWVTTSTSRFISRFSPHISCGKARNALWLYLHEAHGVKRDGWYPIYKQMFIDYDENDRAIARIEPVPVKCVNRKRAKELRSRVTAFVEYGMTVLKLSDGWITYAFREEAYTHARRMLGDRAANLIQTPLAVQDMAEAVDELLPYYMLKVLYRCNNVGGRVSGNNGERDHKFDPEAFKRAAYRMHDDQEPEVYHIDMRMPDGKLFDNIVQTNT